MTSLRLRKGCFRGLPRGPTEDGTLRGEAVKLPQVIAYGVENFFVNVVCYLYRFLARNTQGVTLIRLGESEQLVQIEPVAASVNGDGDDSADNNETRDDL